MLSNCLLLWHVAPPFMFTPTSFPATPTNRLVIMSPALGVYSCTKMWYAEFWQVKFYDCFSTITLYFIWPNFLSVGIVHIYFQSARTKKYATPTGHSTFEFAPLTLTYQFFQRWNQRRLYFTSLEPNNTSQYTSGKFRMGYFRNRSCYAAIMQLLRDGWHVNPAMRMWPSLR